MSFSLRVFLLLTLFAATGWAVPPKITDVTATPGAAGTALLGAKITATSASEVAVFFDYGTTTNYGSTSPTDPRGFRVPGNANATPVTTVLTGLTPGQTYHFRVRAETVEGEKTATADQTFLQSATVTLNPAVHNQPAANRITLRGVVTPNGVAGTAFFEYSENSNFQPLQPTIPTPPQAVAGTEPTVTVSAPLPDPDLTNGPIYFVRLVFIPTGSTRADAIVSTVGRTNTPPKAVADSRTLSSAKPLTIDALENDTDAENDTLKMVPVAALPTRYGTAVITETRITYTPKQELLAADTFRYTVIDGFGGRASALVTIRPLRAVLAGTHGGVIRDFDGKEIGYFRITASSLGSFTGMVEIDGKSYLLSGSFAADGSFHGAASRDGNILPVDLTTVRGEDGTTIRAEFANGKYASSVEFTDTEATTRGPLAGRYTVELPSGGTTTGGDGAGTDTTTTTTTATTLPEGTGWTALKVGGDGSVRVKGRLPDGRSFATRGTLVVGPNGPQITFYEGIEDTRIVGAFNVGDTVTGSLHVDRKRSNDEIFPAGYDVTLSATGARYVSPDDGGGIASSTGEGAEEFTITFNGGGLSSSFSRNLLLTDAGQFKVLNGGRENLKVKVDPSSGRFTTKVTVNDAGKRVKGTGVFVQGNADSSSGGGAGVFLGVTKPGSIQITGGSTPTPVTPPPVVLPTPNPNATPIGIDLNLQRARRR